MTTLRHRVVFACLSIVGTVGIVSFSNPVSAAPVDGARRAPLATVAPDLRQPTGPATSAHRTDAAVN
jgi:hypothetical protein